MKVYMKLMATILMALLLNCNFEEVIKEKKNNGFCEKEGNPNTITCIVFGTLLNSIQSNQTNQSNEIKGNITDRLGNPIPCMIEISEENEKRIIYTDDNGNFSLNHSNTNKNLKFYSDSTFKNQINDVEFKGNDKNFDVNVRMDGSIIRLNGVQYTKRNVIKHSLSYIDQNDSDMGSLGNASCGPTSLAMLYNYYFPNSHIRPKSIYPFTQDVASYDSKVLNYQDVYAPAYIQYMDRYSRFLNISGISISGRITDSNEIYTYLEKNPMLVSVQIVFKDGILLSSSGHFLVLIGYDNKGTEDKTDDSLFIHDPNSKWFNNFNGNSLEINFCDLFSLSESCKNKTHSGISYSFNYAYNAVPDDSKAERQYSTLVTSTNFYVNSYNKVNFENVDNWNFYRGYSNARFYSTLDNQIAYIKPWLNSEGMYEIQINHTTDPTSNPNQKELIQVVNSNGSNKETKEIENYSNSNEFKKVSLGQVCMKNGDYLKITLQKNQNLPDAVYFKYIQEKNCSDTTSQGEFNLTNSSIINGSTGVRVDSKIILEFSSSINSNTIFQGIKLYSDGRELTYNFMGPIGKSIELLPDSPLPNGSQIEIRINSSLESISKVPLTNSTTIKFRTEEKVTYLTVDNISPKDGQKNVPIESSISITLSENPDPSTIRAENIFLTKTGSETKEAVTIKTVGSLITIVPSNKLINQQSYTLKIQNIKGLSGSILSNSISLQFETIATNTCSAISNIGYDYSSSNYTKNLMINPNLLRVTGGSPITNISINRSLPSGLNFNSQNGTISGTPLTTSINTSYIITATNCAGTKSTTISITVSDPNLPPSSLSYSYMNWIFKTAQNVTNSPSVSGTTPMSFSASGLPNGLSIHSTTGVISGFVNTSGYYSSKITATNSAGSTTTQLSLTVRLCGPYSTEYNYNCSILNGTCKYEKVCSSDGMSWGSWNLIVSCNSGYTYNPSTQSCVSIAPPLEIVGSTSINGSMTTYPYTSNTFKVSAKVNSNNDLILTFSKPDGSRFSISGKYKIYDNQTGDDIAYNPYGTVTSFNVTLYRNYFKLGTNRIRILLYADSPNNSVHILDSDFYIKRNQ
ncbi:MAG: Ig-like domain-containing protein [Leptospiraceae bacterium]|nr:Ig-like domain-containing protein [Leptospiraceae bacterium]